MTEGEICRSFLQARNRQRQIQILADLTESSPQKIKKVLTSNGIDPESTAKKGYKEKQKAVHFGMVLPANIRNEVIYYGNHSNYKRRPKRV